jgi:hypothetical protein
MINLDDRIIDINLLNKSEFWLLMHLTKRINKDRKTYPGNELLCKETGFCLNTLQVLKKSLIQKGFLSLKPANTRDILHLMNMRSLLL